MAITKMCPVIHNRMLNSPARRELCPKLLCMWWDMENEQCAVMTMAKAMEEMAGA